MRGEWAHGWIPKNHQLDPRCVIKNIRKVSQVWVARTDEEKYLRSEGYQARAIGLPITYTKPTTGARRQGSLLILPPHSSSVMRFGQDEQGLIDGWRKWSDHFESIVVCVQSYCEKTGDWIKSLEQNGLAYVLGADHADANSLQRMRDLFSQFEFVNTVGFSSAIAYAAAFGARVSVSGPHISPDPTQHRWSAYYQDNPGLYELQANCMTEDVLRELWPSLFAHPHEAVEQTQWGQHQIGMDAKVSPDELRTCFGWQTTNRAKRSLAAKTKQIVRRTVPKPFRVWWHDRRKPASDGPLDRSPSSATSVESPIDVDGRRFHFNSFPTFRGTYAAIFQRQFYRIPVISDAPVILDCGANIGLATRYWLEKYPRAQITAFEPDPDLFKTLEANCLEHPDANVELVQAAVWTENTTLTFQSTGLETGGVSSAGVTDGDAISVQAVALADYLDKPTDFVKLDIEGAEVEVLNSLDGKLDHVTAMYVEYHSFVGSDQRLSEIIRVFEANGFRYSVTANFSSEQPMRKIEESYGMDMRLDLWAWKPQ